MSAAERTQAGDAQQELAESVKILTDRIEALQADVRRLGGPGLPAGDAGWVDEDVGQADTGPPSYAWVGALEPRVRRRPAVPRLLLESLFLVGVAIGCGFAKLNPSVIVGVMAVSWALVALIEWTSARADARRNDIVVTFAGGEQAEPDPSWLVPPVERTLLDAGGATVITRLPPPLADDPPDDADVEAPDDDLTQH